MISNINEYKNKNKKIKNQNYYYYMMTQNFQKKNQKKI